jgi:hypothetical protein
VNLFAKFFPYQWRQFPGTKRFSFFQFIFDEGQYISSQLVSRFWTGAFFDKAGDSPLFEL